MIGLKSRKLIITKNNKKIKSDKSKPFVSLTHRHHIVSNPQIHFFSLQLSAFISTLYLLKKFNFILNKQLVDYAVDQTYCLYVR